jgi:hypothetical protein
VNGLKAWTFREIMRMHFWHLAFMTQESSIRIKDNPVNIFWSIVIKGLRFRINTT